MRDLSICGLAASAAPGGAPSTTRRENIDRRPGRKPYLAISYDHLPGGHASSHGIGPSIDANSDRPILSRRLTFSDINMVAVLTLLHRGLPSNERDLLGR